MLFQRLLWGLRDYSLIMRRPVGLLSLKKDKVALKPPVFTSEELRARVAAFSGPLQSTPDWLQRCFRCHQGHNILRC